MAYHVSVIAIALALYLVFVWWYGGSGRPLGVQEKAQIVAEFRRRVQGKAEEGLIDEAQQLMASDDGKEFVMHNCVRYRPRALYPPGHNYSDDPREADKRYGKAIIPHLLRRACLPVFIARRSGRFIDCPGVPDWHYVAMVRYRSQRDFFNFALAISDSGVDVHKWAAIEQTVVFPVKPIVSFITVRILVGGLLAVVTAALLAAA
jgi:hypothetical protein